LTACTTATNLQRKRDLLYVSILYHSDYFFLQTSEFFRIPSFIYINPDDLHPKCSMSMIFQVKLSPTKCTGNAVDHNAQNVNHLISEDREMKNVQTVLKSILWIRQSHLEIKCNKACIV
jgi:hypothetical protein